jgi:hypothetical protein
MRRWLFLGAFLLLGAADEDKMILEVGEAKVLHLGYKPGMIVCDDLKIVKVEDAGDAIRMTGLAEGKTSCGFRKSAGLPGRVVDVEVVAPKSAKPRKGKP